MILPSLIEWLKERIDAFEAVVFDIDGVLVIDGRPIPGAPAVIDLLRECGKPLGLLTNDGDRSIPEKLALLQTCGYRFDAGEMTSCADGLVEVVRQRGWPRNTPVFVAGGVGNPSYARKAGLREIREPSAIDQCSAAIVADGRYDWQRVCNLLVNHCLRHPDFSLMVPNPDDVYPGRGGELVIAAGALARFICQVLQRRGVAMEPIFLGKPYAPIFEYHHKAMERRLGRPIERSAVLMIGDSPASDIRGARNFGYRSALVLTGITQRTHLPPVDDAVPDWIFETLQ